MVRTPVLGALLLFFSSCRQVVGLQVALGSSRRFFFFPHRRGGVRSSRGSTRRTTEETTTELKANNNNYQSADAEYDAIIIGSGLGGLSCGAVLASQGRKVLVCEAHEHAGGAAHEWSVPCKEGGGQCFRFENGPSLYAGLSPFRSPNPLKHVFQIINEEPEWIKYDRWGTAFEGKTPFAAAVGAEDFENRILPEHGGPDAVFQWRRLRTALRPLGDAVFALPPAAVREDPLAVVTTGLRYMPALSKILLNGGPALLSAPFSKVLDQLEITDRFIRNWLDMLAFLLQGATTDEAPTSLMAYMLSDFYRDGVTLDYPKGGTRAIVDALVKGIEKNNGGKVRTNARVQGIVVSSSSDVMNKQRVQGVTLQDGQTIRAPIVVSNADVWSTLQLQGVESSLPLKRYLKKQSARVSSCASFLHLHLAIRADGLPDTPSEKFPAQWAALDSWDRGVDAPRNLALVSCASLLDPSLAPEGYHVIHAYVPATEPYAPWVSEFSRHNKSGERGFFADDEASSRSSYEKTYQSPAYRAAKAEAADVLWRAVEAYIPDVRDRVVYQSVGTPLTHARFLNRHRGTYGAYLPASTGDLLMGHRTPLDGFWMCGDSTFPGIGVPAVAASGTITANSILSPWEHWNVLDKIKLP